jgi:hypothetical protein
MNDLRFAFCFFLSALELWDRTPIREQASTDICGQLLACVGNVIITHGELADPILR